MNDFRFKAVRRALVNGTIKLINNPNDGCLAAQCGDYWFYFANRGDEFMSPEEYKKTHHIRAATARIVAAMDGLGQTEQDYYRSVLEEMMDYAEVRCDFLDDYTHFWSVDVYESDIDHWSGEECPGRVIAYIDDYSGRVIYLEEDAKDVNAVQEVIFEKTKECKEAHPYSVEDLEMLLQGVVDFEAGEDPADATYNLEAYGFSDEQMRFFGFEPSYED